jgi:hypothetical protein
MSPAEEAFVPNRVLSASEVMRIGVALHVYGKQRTTRSWVVMARERPHQVIGIVDAKAKADSLLRSPGITPTDYEIYGPFDPQEHPYEDRIDPTQHDWGTECSSCDQIEMRGKKGTPKPGDIVKATLKIDWKPGGPTSADDRSADNSITYEIRYNTDTIFLTRHAREAFGYPRYHFLFGAAFVEALRKKLRDPA